MKIMYERKLNPEIDLYIWTFHIFGREYVLHVQPLRFTFYGTGKL